MTADWMDKILDRHPGEAAPAGFGERVRARIESEEATRPAPVLRPVFRQLIPAAAAAVVFLVLGFWLGRGTNDMGNPTDGFTEEPTAGALPDPLEELELLKAWDLVTDEALELGWDGEDEWIAGEEEDG